MPPRSKKEYTKEEKEALTKIGERLTLLRTRRKMNQSELGKALGYSRGAIYNLEAGNSQLTILTLIKYCQYFNVSADFILGIRKSSPPERDLATIDQYELAHIVNEIRKLVK